jgi:hypothetical protein
MGREGFLPSFFREIGGKMSRDNGINVIKEWEILSRRLMSLGIGIDTNKILFRLSGKFL